MRLPACIPLNLSLLLVPFQSSNLKAAGATISALCIILEIVSGFLSVDCALYQNLSSTTLISSRGQDFRDSLKMRERRVRNGSAGSVKWMPSALCSQASYHGLRKRSWCWRIRWVLWYYLQTTCYHGYWAWGISAIFYVLCNNLPYIVIFHSVLIFICTTNAQRTSSI